MTLIRMISGICAAIALAGCSNSWQVDYANTLTSDVTKNWRLVDVVAVVPENLSISESNFIAPTADIVWRGEAFGDRRAQVSAIIDEGLTRGASELNGDRPVTIAARVARFHGVTPAAVARAPSAVHNISYYIQVFDAQTGQALTEQEMITADLEAIVGSAAIAAAINGQTQRVRIVNHLASVTRGWLGYGPDQRRTFAGIGR